MNVVQQIGVGLLITIIYWIGFMIYKRSKDEDRAIKKEIEAIGLEYKG